MFRRFHNATTIIPVDTLPASGIAGVPYMLPDGTFWVWRYVVELTDLNDRLVLGVAGNYNADENTDIKLSSVIRDVIAGASDYTGILSVYSEDNYTIAAIARTPGGNIYLQLQNSDGSTFAAPVSSVKIEDSNFHEVVFQIKNNLAEVCVDGEVIISVSTTGWTPHDSSYIRYSGDNTDFVPFQICCIKQYLSGVLIDWFKCDESTGITLANSGTRTDTATLSAADAHALAWVPLS